MRGGIIGSWSLGLIVWQGIFFRKNPSMKDCFSSEPMISGWRWTVSMPPMGHNFESEGFKRDGERLGFPKSGKRLRWRDHLEALEVQSPRDDATVFHWNQSIDESNSSETKFAIEPDRPTLPSVTWLVVNWAKVNPTPYLSSPCASSDCRETPSHVGCCTATWGIH